MVVHFLAFGIWQFCDHLNLMHAKQDLITKRTMLKSTENIEQYEQKCHKKYTEEKSIIYVIKYKIMRNRVCFF